MQLAVASVNITGIIHRGFNVAEAEKKTGIDLDETLHQQWHGDSYIMASNVQPQ